MTNELAGYFLYNEEYKEWEETHAGTPNSVPLYTHPVKELTPCEELREFQEQQNGVFSEHNACCYRDECRIVWNDWEKLRSNPTELTDEEIIILWNDLVERAILRKAQEK